MSCGFFFFFKQKTAYEMRISDWSSDVCSSDLPDPVLCYRYASDEEDEHVAAVIRRMAAGEVDLIAFTSTAQIRRLKKVAETAGLQDALRHAMSSLRVAAVGPVTAEAVEKAGRSEEHTSELQSLMRISYAVFCLKKKNNTSELKQL